MSGDISVVAIIAAYNEADVIEHVVRDLIDHQIHVYLMDDGSTDATASLIEPYVGRGVIAVERLCRDGVGDRSGWACLLQRKAELAASLDADWFIHHDADEFRESPWHGVSLREGITAVDRLGFNAIDFAGFDFWPTALERFQPGTDVRAAFEFCTSAAEYDWVQIRAWKKTPSVDLVSSGGHDAQFPDRRVFPLRFILRHYPIRGQEHGERKVFRERRERFPDGERERGWHVQYDAFHAGDSFLRDPSTLMRFDPAGVRVDLALRHRGVEALEGEIAARDAMLEDSRRDAARLREEASSLNAALAERVRQIDSWNQRVVELQKNVDGQRGELQRRSMVISNLEGTIQERTKRLDEMQRSRSWRWMAPVRAMFRLLGGS